MKAETEIKEEMEKIKNYITYFPITIAATWLEALRWVIDEELPSTCEDCWSDFLTWNPLEGW